MVTTWYVHRPIGSTGSQNFLKFITCTFCAPHPNRKVMMLLQLSKHQILIQTLFTANLKMFKYSLPLSELLTDKTPQVPLRNTGKDIPMYSCHDTAGSFSPGTGHFQSMKADPGLDTRLGILIFCLGENPQPPSNLSLISPANTS